MHCLLHRGASAEIVTLDGDTPLHFAATQGCVPIIELLVNAGANVNTQVRPFPNYETGGVLYMIGNRHVSGSNGSVGAEYRRVVCSACCYGAWQY